MQKSREGGPLERDEASPGGLYRIPFASLREFQSRLVAEKLSSLRPSKTSPSNASIARDASKAMRDREGAMRSVERIRKAIRSKIHGRGRSAVGNAPGAGRAFDGGGAASESGVGAGTTLCSECDVSSLGCDSPGSGALGEGDCESVDGSFIDVWRFELPESARATLEMTSTAIDTFLYLADDRCEIIDVNDDCVPGDFDRSCITRGLAAGTYFVLANSFDAGETGPYNLRLTCAELTDCADCLAGTISPDETTFGELSAEDCLQADSTFFDVYRFELGEDARVDIDLRSTEVDTILLLLDAGCVELQGNDDCLPGDITRSCLSADLRAGTYHIGVTSFGPNETGSYELRLGSQPGFDLCADCLQGSVACGELLAGAFPESQCTLLDGRAIDLHSFELSDPGPVTIHLRSLDIDPYLFLFDSACQEIAANDDCRETLDSCLENIELDAGRYFIGVSSFSPGESGAFTLELTCPDVSFCRECEVGSVDCGGTASGALAEGDCRLDDKSLADLWRLEVPETSNLSISMTSSAFDPFLSLLNPACEVVASNDDCESGATESCLEILQVPPGTYRVVATSARPGASGPYELRVDCTPFDACLSCIVGELPCGERVSGELMDGDCGFVEGGLYDVWSFSLDRGQRISVELSSDDYEPVAILADGGCGVVAANVCSGDGNGPPCLEVDLAPGDYFLVATSTEPSTGAYALSLSCGDIPACADCLVGPVACNEPLTGSLPTSGCRLLDDTSIDFFRFDLPAADDLQVTLGSSEFDTFLLVYDDSCVPIAANDDCPTGNTTDSCLSLPLAAGTYFMGVNSFSAGEAGQYRLEVAAADCEADSGAQKPGDINEDGRLNVSDAVRILLHLYMNGSTLPCASDEGNRRLLDGNGDGTLDVTDAIHSLKYLFSEGPPHVLGVECTAIGACPDSPACQ